MGIRFGTSGWRGVIADEFTFANVRRVARAICEYLLSSGTGKGGLLIIGYDTRFLGEQFAEECVKETVAGGLNALLCAHPTPTPTLLTPSAIEKRRAE